MPVLIYITLLDLSNRIKSPQNINLSVYFTRPLL